MTLVTTSAIDVLVGATTDVFETMVFRALSAKEPTWGYDVRPQVQVVGTVGFTGSSNGLVAFHATNDLNFNTSTLKHLNTSLVVQQIETSLTNSIT